MAAPLKMRPNFLNILLSKKGVISHFSSLFINICFFFVLSLLGGCGYHFSGNSEPLSLSVPFFVGDRNGIMTSAVVEEVSKSNLLEYGGSQAPYILRLEIVDNHDQQIGFKYRTEDNSSELIRNLSPTESRQTLKVKASIVSKSSGKLLFKPIIVESVFDYDYVDSQSFNDVAFIDENGSTETVLDRSLGQLDAWEDAKTIAGHTHFKVIAKKVINALNYQVVDGDFSLDEKKGTS